jgi:hypothetical protein
MFTRFGVRPQQAKIGFVPTKALLATDLRPSKAQPMQIFLMVVDMGLLFHPPTMLLRTIIYY